LSNDTISHYHQNADDFAALYDSMAAQEVHRSWFDRLVQVPVGRALDVGAGSGRDVRWLASLGWQVTAVEPAAALRQRAESRATSSVTWVDDRLPDLARVRSGHARFELILLSAVWMHIEPDARPQALKALARLLADGGLMVITLRFGPSAAQRPMYPVSLDELRALSAPLGMSVEALSDGALETDQLNRPDVSWQTVLLRHVAGGS
jgi:protein-L-isoaspartate O-methyltransferase